MKALSIPSLNPGEKYAGGIIALDRAVLHVILLPASTVELPWSEGNTWAKEQGGSLPDRLEQLLLWTHLREDFEKKAYWSCEQSANYASWAWCQDFYGGTQGYGNESAKLACRAVRRVLI